MIILVEEKNPNAYEGKVVIVDASVLVDFVLENSPRHNGAVRLFTFLLKHQIRVRIPFHAAFEHMSAIRRNVWFEDGQQAPHARQDNQGLQVQLFAVPIDNAFIERYPTVGLPYMKAGDLLYLAMAKADGAPLITEDQELYDKAQKAGITTFKVSEYVLMDNT